MVVRNFKKEQGSIKIYDKDNNLIYESINDVEGYQTPVELSSLPDHVINSVLSAEDNRFYKHIGVDPLAIIRAIYLNYKSNKVVSGGSTITQQVARRNLYDTNLLRNKYVRKVREMYSAIILDLFYSKHS